MLNPAANKSSNSYVYQGDVRGIQALRHGKGNTKYDAGGGQLFSYTGDWKLGRKVGHGKFLVQNLRSLNCTPPIMTYIFCLLCDICL